MFLNSPTLLLDSFVTKDPYLVKGASSVRVFFFLIHIGSARYSEEIAFLSLTSFMVQQLTGHRKLLVLLKVSSLEDSFLLR